MFQKVEREEDKVSNEIILKLTDGGGSRFRVLLCFTKCSYGLGNLIMKKKKYFQKASMKYLFFERLLKDHKLKLALAYVDIISKIA